MVNETMLDMHYKDSQIRDCLKAALANIFSGFPAEQVFICLGSDRHILDCFGPLIGTMVKEMNPQTLIYGRLEQPLHAKNISREIEVLNSKHPNSIKIAIDASVGEADDIGKIKIRRGAIIPGKALAKKLPPVGDYAITGVLGNHQDRQNIISSNSGSLVHVYPMAKIIAAAICEYHQREDSG
jgi:putative sporulation protein YyaC